MWQLGASRTCSTSINKCNIFIRALVERLNATLITFTDGHKSRMFDKYGGGYNTEGQKEVGNTGKR